MYLDTEESVRHLVSEFGGARISGFSLAKALIGSSHRGFVQALMQQGLAEPARAIDSEYLTTLSLVSVPSGVRYSPFKITESLSPKEYARLEKDIRANASRVQRARTGYLERLVTLLPGKTVGAMPITFLTVMDETTQLQDKSLQSTIRIKMGPYLTQLFPTLNKEQQHTVLEQWWDYIDHSSTIPVLRQIVSHPQRRGEWVPEVPFGLTDVAMYRFLQVSPHEAYQALAEDLKKPEPEFSDEVYMGNVAIPLKQIDSAIVSNIQSHFRARRYSEMNRLIYFANRFASPGALPSLESFYRRHRNEIGCDVQGQLLAYLKRWAPSTEASLISAAKTDPNNQRCHMQVTDSPVNLYPVTPF